MSPEGVSDAAPSRLVLDYGGEVVRIPPEGTFALGREADFQLDDNPYLHRRLIELSQRQGVWWLANVGTQISLTVSDGDGRLEAWLAPGGALPLLFAATTIRFSAGTRSYELTAHLAQPVYAAPDRIDASDGETTMGTLVLNPEQRLMLLALAEPRLRDRHHAQAHLPASADVAARLGWTPSKFNRKLDYLCEKLDGLGVRGLHGGAGNLASNRRSRLVEYALAVRMISSADLVDLDAHRPDASDEDA